MEDLKGILSILGIALPVVLMVLGLATTLPIVNSIDNAIAECEKDLPRSQQCGYRITAEVLGDE